MNWNLVAVDWLAVAMAAGVGLLVGFVWYAPPMFGRRWEKAAGVELPHVGRGLGPGTLVLSIATVVLTAYALAILANAVGLHSAVDGAILGFVGWLGFFLTATTNAVIFEGRKPAYWSLTAGLGLVTLIAMGAVIGYFA